MILSDREHAELMYLLDEIASIVPEDKDGYNAHGCYLASRLRDDRNALSVKEFNEFMFHSGSIATATRDSEPEISERIILLLEMWGDERGVNGETVGSTTVDAARDVLEGFPRL
jgi:hypothetical protein